MKRAALLIKCNDLAVASRHIIPVVARPAVTAASKTLRDSLSGWDNTFWNLRDWFRDRPA